MSHLLTRPGNAVHQKSLALWRARGRCGHCGRPSRGVPSSPAALTRASLSPGDSSTAWKGDGCRATAGAVTGLGAHSTDDHERGDDIWPLLRSDPAATYRTP